MVVSSENPSNYVLISYDLDVRNIGKIVLAKGVYSEHPEHGRIIVVECAGQGWLYENGFPTYSLLCYEMDLYALEGIEDPCKVDLWSTSENGY